jgi:hypothetical protein
MPVYFATLPDAAIAAADTMPYFSLPLPPLLMPRQFARAARYSERQASAMPAQPAPLLMLQRSHARSWLALALPARVISSDASRRVALR